MQRIVGEGVEVTALTWACDSLDGTWRTFCAALDGSLAEVRWKEGKLEASSDSGAGAIWSLAAQPASAVSPGKQVLKPKVQPAVSPGKHRNSRSSLLLLRAQIGKI